MNLTSGAIQNGVPTEVFRRRRVLVSCADTPGRRKGSCNQSNCYFHPRQSFWMVPSLCCPAKTSSAGESQIHLSSFLEREAQSSKALSTSDEVLCILCFQCRQPDQDLVPNEGFISNLTVYFDWLITVFYMLF